AAVELGRARRARRAGHGAAIDPPRPAGHDAAIDPPRPAGHGAAIDPPQRAGSRAAHHPARAAGPRAALLPGDMGGVRPGERGGRGLRLIAAAAVAEEAVARAGVPLDDRGLRYLPDPRALGLPDLAWSAYGSSAMALLGQGGNYEIQLSRGVAICRVWRRPDVSREEGAR